MNVRNMARWPQVESQVASTVVNCQIYWTQLVEKKFVIPTMSRLSFFNNWIHSVACCVLEMGGIVHWQSKPTPFLVFVNPRIMSCALPFNFCCCFVARVIKWLLVTFSCLHLYRHDLTVSREHLNYHWWGAQPDVKRIRSFVECRWKLDDWLSIRIIEFWRWLKFVVYSYFRLGRTRFWTGKTAHDIWITIQKLKWRKVLWVKLYIGQ